MPTLARYRRSRDSRRDALYLAVRLRQAEKAAAEAICIEAIDAHAVMALHYRVRLAEIGG